MSHTGSHLRVTDQTYSLASHCSGKNPANANKAGMAHMVHITSNFASLLNSADILRSTLGIAALPTVKHLCPLCRISVLCLQRV